MHASAGPVSYAAGLCHLSSCTGKVIHLKTLYSSWQPAPKTCCLLALACGHSLPEQADCVLP